MDEGDKKVCRQYCSVTASDLKNRLVISKVLKCYDKCAYWLKERCNYGYVYDVEAELCQPCSIGCDQTCFRVKERLCRMVCNTKRPIASTLSSKVKIQTHESILHEHKTTTGYDSQIQNNTGNKSVEITVPVTIGVFLIFVLVLSFIVKCVRNKLRKSRSTNEPTQCTDSTTGTVCFYNSKTSYNKSCEYMLTLHNSESLTNSLSNNVNFTTEHSLAGLEENNGAFDGEKSFQMCSGLSLSTAQDDGTTNSLIEQSVSNITSYQPGQENSLSDQSEADSAKSSAYVTQNDKRMEKRPSFQRQTSSNNSNSNSTQLSLNSLCYFYAFSNPNINDFEIVEKPGDIDKRTADEISTFPAKCGDTLNINNIWRYISKVPCKRMLSNGHYIRIYCDIANRKALLDKGTDLGLTEDQFECIAIPSTDVPGYAFSNVKEYDHT